MTVRGYVVQIVSLEPHPSVAPTPAPSSATPLATILVIPNP